MRYLILSVLIIFVASFFFVVSCTKEEQNYSFEEVIYNKNSTEEDRVLKSIMFSGTHTETIESNLNCIFTSNRVNLLIDGFNLGQLFVPSREPPMPCWRFDSNNIICKQHVISPYWWWWDTFYLQYDNTQELATLTWESKINDDTWCVYIFLIDNIVGYYE